MRPHLGFSLTLLALSPTLFTGCGGAAAESASTTEKPPSVTDREIAEAAAAQGGIAAIGNSDNGKSRPLMASTLKADMLTDGDKVKLDGVLGEWPARTKADTLISGASQDGLTFNAGIRYDASTIYVGGEVTTASFHRTARFGDNEDHASFILAFGTPTAPLGAYEVNLFAGKPGETTGQVRYAGRGAVPGARIVEAPMSGGYSFEAAIPWSAFPEARTVRVGLRGAARYYEHADSGLRVVATGGGDARHTQDLLPIPTEPEQSLEAGFLKDHDLVGRVPSIDLLINVTGDGMKERVSVWGSMFTVCGPGYRGGKDYFFRDVGAPIVRMEARPITGSRKDDLMLVRRVSEGPMTRDWFEVFSFLGKDDPSVTFGQEMSVSNAGQHVDNAIHAAAGEIDVSVLPARGWDASSYNVPLAADVQPILLPWGAVKSQTFRFDGQKFVKAREVAQKPTGHVLAGPGIQAELPVARIVRDPEAVRATVAATQAPAPPASAANLLQQYRRDHGVGDGVATRFSVAADLDGDGQPDRIALVDRDIVVSGAAIGEGHGYSFLTLQPFASGGDIHEVTARDLSGQGKSHLIVRGTRHITAARGAGLVDEDILLVYSLQNGALARVFAIETARAQGGKRVQGLVQFVPATSGHGLDIDVRPGRASGWTKASYPWPEEQPGGGSMEPLLLPWGSIPSLRYAWDGAKFTQ